MRASKTVRLLPALISLVAVIAPMASHAGATDWYQSRQAAWNNANSPRKTDTHSFYAQSHHDKVEWRVQRVDPARSLSWTIENNQDEHTVTCTLAANADIPTCPQDRYHHYHRPAKLTIYLRPASGQGAVLTGIWGDPGA